MSQYYTSVLYRLICMPIIPNMREKKHSELKDKPWSSFKGPNQKTSFIDDSQTMQFPIQTKNHTCILYPLSDPRSAIRDLMWIRSRDGSINHPQFHPAGDPPLSFDRSTRAARSQSKLIASSSLEASQGGPSLMSCQSRSILRSFLLHIRTTNELIT